MSASAHPGRSTDVREDRDRPSFLASHRALAVCTREFARLIDEIEREVEAMHEQGILPKPDVRRSPGRCILQLGPVALTLSWLRGTLDTAADGELLVIGWRGEVSPRPTVRGTSPTPRAGRMAAELWEDLLVAEATTETDWRWRTKNGRGGGMSSPELVRRWSERLRDEYLAIHNGQ